MNELYETKISAARWMAYDIPGNIGWITWIVCAAVILSGGMTPFGVISAAVALVMLTGVIELISERIAGLDRVLPKKRLLRGFGALTAGGIAGVPTALYGVIAEDGVAEDGVAEDGVAGAGGRTAVIMLISAALCGLFASLCFIGYRKREM
ncbi:MAG: hypothetical protein IJT56_11185 [Clostridia bacterium]|nr:hypothetical protein [Clostridia bacterium]